MGVVKCKTPITTFERVELDMASRARFSMGKYAILDSLKLNNPNLWGQWVHVVPCSSARARATVDALLELLSD